MRIGDAERDEAVDMLREHHATGRLSTEEFDDRMGRALSARTHSELIELFNDLPTPKPGASGYGATAPGSASPYSYGTPEPQPYGTTASPYGSFEPPAYGAELNPYEAPPEAVPATAARPWYAQWWMIVIAVVAAGALDFGFPLVMMTAVWLWVIYPAVFEQRRNRALQHAAGPPRPLTYSEREWVMDEVRAGRKINAIKRYRELTGADLRTAKSTVDSWSRQIGR